MPWSVNVNFDPSLKWRPAWVPPKDWAYYVAVHEVAKKRGLLHQRRCRHFDKVKLSGWIYGGHCERGPACTFAHVIDNPALVLIFVQEIQWAGMWRNDAVFLYSPTPTGPCQFCVNDFLPDMCTEILNDLRRVLCQMDINPKSRLTHVIKRCEEPRILDSPAAVKILKGLGFQVKEEDNIELCG